VCTLTVDADGDGLPDEGGTGADETEATLARSFLRQNQPNPFNPTTRMAFFVAGSASREVTLEVFDLRGAKIRTLAERAMEPGEHSIVWDGTDSRGRTLASGVYFAKLTVDGETDAAKMIMLK
jgi:flagellar hook assembly protein FlgD